MSSQNSPDPGRGVVVQKPKADIYTALLGIALAAVLLAIICLWLELSRYKYDHKATGASAVGYVPTAEIRNSDASGPPAATRGGRRCKAVGWDKIAQRSPAHQLLPHDTIDDLWWSTALVGRRPPKAVLSHPTAYV